MNPRVARLPQWRGFPIPFFVTWREDVPDFKVVSEGNRRRCAKEHLCWICGEALDYYCVFLGGPISAQHRTYVDGPMHEECARDALRICPFLVGRTDYSKAAVQEGVHVLKETSDQAPESMVLYKTRSFKIKPSRAGWVFFAAPPVELETIERGGHK